MKKSKTEATPDQSKNIHSVIAKLESIWSVKYAPNKIEDLACSENIKSMLESAITTNTIPNHLCFYGTPGTGKNSIVNIIRHNMNVHLLIINASEENGIDDIRGKVLNFTKSGALFDKPKIVVMNEADGLTTQAQNSMRELMESKTDSCRFIFTCNSINHIIPALKSRFSVYRVDPPVAEVARILVKILKEEKIKFTKGFILKLIKVKGKDLRKLLNESQTLSSRYDELVEDVFSSNTEDYIEVFDNIFETKGLKAIGDIVKSTAFEEDIYTVLANYCIEKNFPTDSIPIVADHMYRSYTVYDKDVMFLSCILTLKEMLKIDQLNKKLNKE